MIVVVLSAKMVYVLRLCIPVYLNPGPSVSTAEIRKSFSRFDCGPERLRPGFCRNQTIGSFPRDPPEFSSLAESIRSLAAFSENS